MIEPYPTAVRDKAVVQSDAADALASADEVRRADRLGELSQLLDLSSLLPPRMRSLPRSKVGSRRTARNFSALHLGPFNMALHPTPGPGRWRSLGGRGGNRSLRQTLAIDQSCAFHASRCSARPCKGILSSVRLQTSAGGARLGSRFPLGARRRRGQRLNPILSPRRSPSQCLPSEALGSAGRSP